MRICHVVAMAENRCIGKNGRMPWHLPEDLKHFKETTQGACVIMGRKTYESIGRPLPLRLNIVISRSWQPGNKQQGLEVCSTLDNALDLARQQQDFRRDEVYIIGGGEIYSQSMAMVDTLYLTRVHQTFGGDTFYPPLDENRFETEWQREIAGSPALSFIKLRKKA